MIMRKYLDYSMLNPFSRQNKPLITDQGDCGITERN